MQACACTAHLDDLALRAQGLQEVVGLAGLAQLHALLGPGARLGLQRRRVWPARGATSQHSLAAQVPSMTPLNPHMVPHPSSTHSVDANCQQGAAGLHCKLQAIHHGATLMICAQTGTSLTKGIFQVTRKPISGGRQCRSFIVQEALQQVQ